MEQPKPSKPVVCSVDDDNLTVYHTPEAAAWVREQVSLFCYGIVHHDNRASAFVLPQYDAAEVVAWLEQGPTH